MFSIDLSGQVVWVTGASRGIGRAIALAFGQSGARVAVGYLTHEEKAKEVVHAVESQGTEALALRVDVSKKEQCESAYSQIKEKWGTLDILVNNAGVTADNLFLLLEPADWAKVIETNVLGVVNATKVVLSDMMMRRKGRIINLSSVSATKGGRGQTNYAATKGAVEAMTRALAVELASRNININCIAPGVVETDMSAEVIKLGRDEILKRQLVKRFAAPEEIAAWAVFIGSKYGDFMTGQIIHVDGGLRMA